MASKRQRGQAWEFTVKRAGLLEKPLTLTFRTEAEGDEYCRRLEALLDRGIVPTEYRPQSRTLTVAQLVETYLREAHPSKKDQQVLNTLLPLVGSATLASIDADWVDGLVATLKREHRLAPNTIRSKIGSLARCTDWGMRRKILVMPDHPFRTLPERYANYTREDTALAGTCRVDEERERRLEPGEEPRIREVLAAGVLARKQRPFVLPHRESLEVLFGLALESAMRLSEMLTLTPDQVFLERQAVFLDETKNGDKRAVPLSSVAVKLLRGRAYRGAHVFPWLDLPTRSRNPVKNAANHVSKVFSGVFEQAGCPDLVFHDLRHEATSRLFEWVAPDGAQLAAEEIMKITGHKNHKMLMRYLKLRLTKLASKMW